MPQLWWPGAVAVTAAIGHRSAETCCQPPRSRLGGAVLQSSLGEHFLKSC